MRYSRAPAYNPRTGLYHGKGDGTEGKRIPRGPGLRVVKVPRARRPPKHHADDPTQDPTQRPATEPGAGPSAEGSNLEGPCSARWTYDAEADVLHVSLSIVGLRERLLGEQGRPGE